jgi:pyridoxal phosphate enzyme (YggS family)
MIINKLTSIQNEIQLKIENSDILSLKPTIIAISKTYPMSNILPLIENGHMHYGENKVQETLDKWTDMKIKNKEIALHLVGKLQTNKVKFAIKIFDYIHSLDSEKLAKKIAEEQAKQNKNIKIFIQVNIGNENQKSGINKENVASFYSYCKDLKLNVIGTMCIPPKEDLSKGYFLEMNKINKKLGLTDLSMGMSSDYLEAVQHNATFLRIGSKILANFNLSTPINQFY